MLIGARGAREGWGCRRTPPFKDLLRDAEKQGVCVQAAALAHSWQPFQHCVHGLDHENLARVLMPAKLAVADAVAFFCVLGEWRWVQAHEDDPSYTTGAYRDRRGLRWAVVESAKNRSPDPNAPDWLRRNYPGAFAIYPAMVAVARLAVLAARDGEALHKDGQVVSGVGEGVAPGFALPSAGVVCSNVRLARRAAADARKRLREAEARAEAAATKI